MPIEGSHKTSMSEPTVKPGMAQNSETTATPAPLRVLTYLHSFEPGGVERVALRLVRMWRSEGLDAPLFLGREDGPMRAEMAQGLDYHAPKQPFFSTAPFETLWMIFTLPGHIRRVCPDVLFCAGNSYAIVSVAMRLILGRACPPIVAKISNDLARRDMPAIGRVFYRRWLRIQGRFFTRIVGMEEPMRAEIAEGMGAADPHIDIVPDPALSEADIERLRSAPRSPGAAGRRFVSIGRLAPQKNFPMMLRAFARAAGPEDTLTIFGEGPLRGELERLAAKLGIADRLRLAGHVPESAHQLGDFDIFLLSSRFEGVPAVIIEALAANMPIIATDCSVSMRALLANGALGTLVPEGDEAAFADAMAAVLSGSQDSAGSLAQARRFTVEASAHAYWASFAKSLER